MKDFTPPPKEIIEKLIEIDGYKGQRNYPTLKKQLEMLYDDIKDDKLGAKAKTGKFFKTIDKVKTDNPKPENQEKLIEELRELEIKHGLNTDTESA